MSNSQKDFEIHKALSWSAIHKIKSIWNSKMENSLKIRTFKATIEPILYGSECRIINSTMRKKIDGCYTRLLRMTTNISWKYMVTNTLMYRGMPKISEVINQIFRLPGHCVSHTDELALNLNVWKPNYGIRKGNKPIHSLIS